MFESANTRALLRTVHDATLMIETSRDSQTKGIGSSVLRAQMVSTALQVIHHLRNRQRTERANGHARRATYYGFIADIADDMLDTALGIESPRSDPCANQ